MTVNGFYFMLRFGCVLTIIVFSRVESISVNCPPLGPLYAGKMEAHSTVSFLSPNNPVSSVAGLS